MGIANLASPSSGASLSVVLYRPNGAQLSSNWCSVSNPGGSCNIWALSVPQTINYRLVVTPSSAVVDFDLTVSQALSGSLSTGQAQAVNIGSNGITIEHIARALAAFERTLVSSESAFDRYQYAGDETALSASATRGLKLFGGRAGCANCHSLDGSRATFTDYQFHSIGVNLTPLMPRLAQLAERVVAADKRLLDNLISEEPEIAALGRFVVTKNPQDIGGFRTPSLRNVAVTGPYMHDGSVPTLEMALEFEAYYRGLRSNEPLILTPSEKADLIAFLHSLTSNNARGFRLSN